MPCSMFYVSLYVRMLERCYEIGQPSTARHMRVNGLPLCIQFFPKAVRLPSWHLNLTRSDAAESPSVKDLSGPLRSSHHPFLHV